MPEFASPAEHYERFMGRYTVPLARALADEVRVRRGMRVLDVGCGPGGLTSELAGRVGAENVAAIDPAEQFVATCRERNPGADVRLGVAEELALGERRVRRCALMPGGRLHAGRRAGTSSTGRRDRRRLVDLYLCLLSRRVGHAAIVARAGTLYLHRGARI